MYRTFQNRLQELHCLIEFMNNYSVLVLKLCTVDNILTPFTRITFKIEFIKSVL